MQKQISPLYRPCVLANAVSRFVSDAAELLCAWLLSLMLAAIMEANWTRAWQIAGVTVACLSACALLVWLTGKRSGRVTDVAQQRYRELLCEAVIRQRTWFPTSGEFHARMEKDAETITRFFSTACPQGIVALLELAVCGGLLASRHGGLGLIFLLMSLLQLLPTLLYEKWAKSVYEKAVHNDEAFSDWISAGLRGIATLKSFRQEGWFLSRLKKYRQDVVNAAKKENATATVEDVVTELIHTLLQDGSYLILGMAALNAAVGVAEIPVLLVLSQHMFSAVANLVHGRVLQSRYQQALAHLDELHSPRRDEEASQKLVLHAERIAKSYGEKQVLQPMTLDIRPGDRILLRGRNGSGKTTLLRILLGLSEPDTGAVYRGRQRVAFALQEEPALNVPMEQLAQTLAARGALSMTRFLLHAGAFQVTEVLERTPEACSAGQRKKVYLALALSCASDLLVLDEPTNHLDTDSVAYLLRQLDKYPGALLICSHDPRVTMQRIWTMEGGQLHEA